MEFMQQDLLELLLVVVPRLQLGYDSFLIGGHKQGHFVSLQDNSGQSANDLSEY